VELFFDVVKFGVHMLDVFAQAKPVDGFTLQLKIYDGGFLPHMLVLEPNRLGGAVSAQRALHMGHHVIEVVDLVPESINRDGVIELFTTVDHPSFIILTRRDYAKSGKANRKNGAEYSRSFHRSFTLPDPNLNRTVAFKTPLISPSHPQAARGPITYRG
jgi:hypothetical protein